MAWSTEITYSSEQTTSQITFTCTQKASFVIDRSSWISDYIVVDNPSTQFIPAEDFAKISTSFNFTVTPDSSSWNDIELSYTEISRQKSKITYQITFSARGVKCKINDTKTFTVTYQVISKGYHSAYWGRKNFLINSTSLAQYNRIDDRGEDLQYKQYFNFIDNGESYRLPVAEYSDSTQFSWIPKKQLIGYQYLSTDSSSSPVYVQLNENDYWGTPRFKSNKNGDLQLLYSVNKNTYKLSKGSDSFEFYYLDNQGNWVKDTKTIPLSVTRVIALVQAPGGGGAGGLGSTGKYVGGGGGGGGAAGLLALALDVLDSYDLIFQLGTYGQGGTSIYSSSGSSSATPETFRGKKGGNTLIEYVEKNTENVIQQVCFEGGHGGGDTSGAYPGGNGGLVTSYSTQSNRMFFWLMNCTDSVSSLNPAIATGGSGGRGCIRTDNATVQTSATGTPVSGIVAPDCPGAHVIVTGDFPFTVWYDTICLTYKSGGESTSTLPYIGGGGGASLLSSGGSIYKNVLSSYGAGGSGGYAYTAENKNDGQNGGGSIIYLWWPKE